MSFDREGLKDAVAQHGKVARVVVVSALGSTPREAGTSFLVWDGGQAGTIGGGALELQAALRARGALATGDRFDKVSLGPDIGQCCGGAVTLLTEVWDSARLAALSGPVVRAMPGFSGEMPLKVANRLRAARNGTRALVFEQIQGWLIEPLTAARQEIWIWGAGHVGRAIIDVLRPLPGLRLVWADTAEDRFPGPVEGVAQRVAVRLPDLVAGAPTTASHLILTYSHALDLELCHQLLAHGFDRCGLIGSETKWARFRSRLMALGHGSQTIDRIDCPIGNPALGKHPQAIAIGVAQDVLQPRKRHASRQENAG
ncbi:xanthine dehydrogenase accessory protein XdhC [Thioclava sp. FR2]|uniref:xanthine dehydrogenase accessory protein XdhC n=1 Tax=Thioclava sp. FR2 TaxID=3445780 RepID=UPI003EB6F4B8